MAVFLTISAFFGDSATYRDKVEITQESPAQKIHLGEKTANTLNETLQPDQSPKEEPAQKINNTTAETVTPPPQETTSQEEPKKNIPPNINKNARSAIVNIFCEMKKEIKIVRGLK